MPWSSFIAFAFATAFSPGVNCITSMAHGTKIGFKKSYPFNIGVSLGVIVVLTVSTLFSGTIMRVIPQFMMIMQAVGTAYLLWLAYGMLKHEGGFDSDKSGGATIRAGFFLQFINPKAYFYCITSMSTFVLPYTDNITTIVLAGAVLVVVGFLGTAAWAIFGSIFKKLFSKYAKITNAVLALLLVYVAISIWL
ncbi:MAG: LysE family transporter [Tissierellia bacterium]|nr:LysE family transporter [Tissierellia bacterium]